MDPVSLVAARWKFRLPTDYLLALDKGLLVHGRAGALNHSVLRWLTPPEIATHDWPEHKVATLVPFAEEPSTAGLCWSTARGPGWVFFSPVDSAQAEGFARSFAGATFRCFLEELRGTAVARNLDWTTDTLINSFRQCVAACDDLWSAEWKEAALRLLSQPASIGKTGLVAFAEWPHIQSEVRRLLPFLILNVELPQSIDQ